MTARPRSSRGEEWIDSTGAVIGRDRRRPAKPISESEKRAFERLSISRRARVTELDQFGTPNAELSCYATNISRGGLGLCAPRMIHMDRRILIEVFGSPTEEARLFFGIVRQCRYAEGQGYIVGVQFEPMPKSPAMGTWLSRRKKRPQAD